VAGPGGGTDGRGRGGAAVDAVDEQVRAVPQGFLAAEPAGRAGPGLGPAAADHARGPDQRDGDGGFRGQQQGDFRTQADHAEEMQDRPMPDEVDGKADNGERAGSGEVADHELLASCWVRSRAEVGAVDAASVRRIQATGTRRR
jgi:hypothetical protein